MLQRTIFENINGYAHGRFTWEVKRSMGISAMFPRSASGQGDTLLAAVHGSKHTVEGYTDSYLNIVQMAYGVVERKLFSLPKLLLMPGILIKQPWLVVTVLPE